MNLFVRMVVYLTIGVFLLACESNKEEDIKVALNYKQPRQTEYPEANYRYFNQRPVLVQKHHIDLTDFIQKHLYDETDLDENKKELMNLLNLYVESEKDQSKVGIASALLKSLDSQ